MNKKLSLAIIAAIVIIGVVLLSYQGAKMTANNNSTGNTIVTNTSTINTNVSITHKQFTISLNETLGVKPAQH